MKTIMVSLPRSGSTSITKYVQKITNSNERMIYDEPFNIRSLRTKLLTYSNVLENENVFVKTMIGQKPTEFQTMKDMDYYQKIKNDFDNIILLDRLNLKEQVESFSRAKMVGKWHEKYYYDEKMFRDVDHISREFFIEMKEFMTELTKLFDTKIYYYEDIYTNKETTKDFLSVIGVEFNEEYYNQYLDTSKKYRIGKPPVTSLI